jgi:hypothetical protein
MAPLKTPDLLRRGPVVKDIALPRESAEAIADECGDLTEIWVAEAVSHEKRCTCDQKIAQICDEQRVSRNEPIEVTFGENKPVRVLEITVELHDCGRAGVDPQWQLILVDDHLVRTPDSGVALLK